MPSSSPPATTPPDDVVSSSCPLIPRRARPFNPFRAPKSSRYRLWSHANACLPPAFRRGHVIDVSWAVVQRSQGQLVTCVCCLRSTDVTISGFLDGGDRNIAPPPSMPPPPAETENSPDNSPAENSPKGTQTFVVSIAVTSTLLIKNLPSLLFSQPSELKPLLLPFGQIKTLDIIETSGSGANPGSITVAVEYETADSAYEVKMTLDGQVYVGNIIKIEFVQPVPSACDTLALQVAQFPLGHSPSLFQAPPRPPLMNPRYSYNSRSAGMNTPANGFTAAGMGALGPVSSSAPTTPYPFSSGSGTAPYFAPDTHHFDERLDNAQPLTRFSEI